MPVDIMCIECDSVDVHTTNGKNFVKNGMVHEHWKCNACGKTWVDEIPEDEYEEIPDNENVW